MPGQYDWYFVVRGADAAPPSGSPPPAELPPPPTTVGGERAALWFGVATFGAQVVYATLHVTGFAVTL